MEVINLNGFNEPVSAGINGQNVAALYLRLSKEDIDKINEGDDSESIKNQRLLLVEEAAKRGFVVGGIYSDEDYSGTDSSRPEFNRLIEDAKLKKFSAIICKSQSRFTRDMEVSEKYINRIFPLLGIRFIGVVDHVDTDIKENKKARQINALINEWYVEDLSENIRSVFKSKMRQGQYLGAFAAYGYKKDEKDRHKLVVDYEAASVVKKIFKYCIEGYGVSNICCQLREEKILTPSAYKESKGLNFKNQNSKKCGSERFLWSQSTIKRILSNEVYIGTLIQGREKKLSYKSKKTVVAPKEEWVVIENNHEPIIPTEDFYKAREILSLRRKFSKVSDKEHKAYPLAGKVKCQSCGRTMARSGQKGKNGNYFRCGAVGGQLSEKCADHSVKYQALEDEILRALQNNVDDVLNDEEDFEYIMLRAMEEKDFSAAELRNCLKNLYGRKDKLNSALKNCFMDKYSGDIDDVMFLELKNELKGKMQSVLNEIAAYENELKVHTESKNKEKYRDFIKKCCAFAELTNEIAYNFINFVEVGDKDENGVREVVVHWNF